MNKQVIEYVEFHIGLFGTTTRTLRNPKFYGLGLGKRRAKIEGAICYGRLVTYPNSIYSIQTIKWLEFFNHSRSYFA